ncbi:MAG: SRPBCC domain-containing protein [Sulfitobacter sp.]
MADIRVEREFKVTPIRLFEVISSQVMLIQWWGHDGMTLPEENLDFSKLGPWYSVMISDEGNRFKMSGQVTRVDPPNAISFTWGWHEDADHRGPESHVTFTVVETAKGSKPIIDHRELPTQEIAARHATGWSGPMTRLARFVNQN